MSTARRLHYSYADYLRCLADSPLRLEYCDGAIYAMAGGTLPHAQLAASMMRELGVALRGQCHLFSADAKVRVEATDLTTFPDVSVVCGERRTSSIDAHALTNPTLLVEVTSKSTEDYDRGEKLSHYRQLPSLQAVLFVSHRERRITCVERTAQGWAEREARGGETLHLAAPTLALSVDAVYDGVELDAA